MAKSVIEILPGDIYGALLSYSYFADIPVFLLRESTVQSKIDQALAGAMFKSAKTGVAVTVLLPEVDVNFPNTPGPQLNVIQRVRVQEIPLINFGSTGTKKSAEAIMEKVMDVVMFLSGDACYSDLHPEKEFVTPRTDLGPVTYDLTWRCTVLRDELGRVISPRIALSGETGLLTLTCETPGAVIWFSVDDSYPRPSVGGVAANGTLYGGPFGPGLAAMPYNLRAVAFDPAGVLAPSDIAFEEINAMLLEEGGGFLRDDETGQVITNDP